MSRAISVCLPVWNGENFLLQAIESVLSQEDADFELIISDDGSSDNSQAVINQFRTDPRVVVLEPSAHSGLFQNYNRCIAASQAPVIKFFAQDDILLPGSLAKILAGFSSNQAIALVSTAKEVIDSAGESVNDQMIPTVASYISSYDKAPLLGRLVYETILRSGVNFIGEPCTVAVRRNALGELFDTSFVHVGDLEYWIRVLQFGDYLHLTERLCKFRQHSKSATRANLKGLRFATDLLRLFAKHESLSKDLGINLQEQRKNLLSSLASHTYLLDAGDEINLTEVHGVDILDCTSKAAIIEELRLARELLFGTLVQLGAVENRFSWEQKELAAIFAREREIRDLERSVRLLLGSHSWRLTRALRELRARLLGLETTELLFSCTESSAQDSIAKIAERQIAYLNYLDKLHQEILNSRSWKLTAPLRLLHGRKET
jgi:glycosyltransferase involved in cell wall biosynthesis